LEGVDLGARGTGGKMGPVQKEDYAPLMPNRKH